MGIYIFPVKIMKKILLIILLLSSFRGHGQSCLPNSQSADSVTFFTVCQPNNTTGGLGHTFAMNKDSLLNWISRNIGGGSTDTTSLSNRINLKLDSVVLKRYGTLADGLNTYFIDSLFTYDSLGTEHFVGTFNDYPLTMFVQAADSGISYATQTALNDTASSIRADLSGGSTSLPSTQIGYGTGTGITSNPNFYFGGGTFRTGFGTCGYINLDSTSGTFEYNYCDPFFDLNGQTRLFQMGDWTYDWYGTTFSVNDFANTQTNTSIADTFDIKSRNALPIVRVQNIPIGIMQESKIVVWDTTNNVLYEVPADSIPSSGWGLTGNNTTGINAVLGTTNDSALNIIVNNSPYGRIDTLNIDLGRSAGSNPIGDSFLSIAIGDSALYGSSGNSNKAIGFRALAHCTGQQNIGIGDWAGLNGIGADNVMIGWEAGVSTSTLSCEFFGDATGVGSQGKFQECVGYGAGFGDSCMYAEFIGYLAGYGAVGDHLVGLGSNALVFDTASDVIALGDSAGFKNNRSHAFFIGKGDTSTCLLCGTFDNKTVYVNGQIAIGTASPQAQLEVNGNAIIDSNCTVKDTLKIGTQSTLYEGFGGILEINNPTAISLNGNDIIINNITATAMNSVAMNITGGGSVSWQPSTFTGTDTILTVNGLATAHYTVPAYANDAAAAIGGLTTGQLWQTSGGDITVCGGTIGVIMIKQ